MLPNERFNVVLACASKAGFAATRKSDPASAWVEKTVDTAAKQIVMLVNN
jgi:hypothetical protein